MHNKKFRQLAAVLADRSLQELSAAPRAASDICAQSAPANDDVSRETFMGVRSVQTFMGARSAQTSDTAPGAQIFADLCAYEALLRKWQPHINLIAQSTLADFWRRHILDSAQLFNFKPEAKIWLDLGSGAGFPALVLACLLKQRNQQQNSGKEKAQIFLVESNGKKAGFLRKIIQELGLPAAVFQQRIETALADLPVPEVITARALASLDGLCRFIAPLNARAKHNEILAILPKGSSAEEEIAEAEKNWNFQLERRPSRIQADSVILLLRNIREKSRG